MDGVEDAFDDHVYLYNRVTGTDSELSAKSTEWGRYMNTKFSLV